jgi:hypothetical protein
MKRMMKHSLLIVLVLTVCSCEKTFTPENTAMVGFAGEWYYKLFTIGGEEIYDYDYEGPLMMTYNSSENVPGKLWVDDNLYTFPLKALMDISGSPGSFTGTGGINLAVIPYPDSIPAAAGVPLSVLVDDFVYVEIMEGKILKDAARVWQDKEQAVTDSLYLVLKFSNAILYYTSREAVVQNEDGTRTTVYIWERDEDSYQVGEALDTFIVAGHRQTGWEVYL